MKISLYTSKYSNPRLNVLGILLTRFNRRTLLSRDVLEMAQQLADQIGTSPQYLNKIIHGERSGEKYIDAIKQILGIAV